MLSEDHTANFLTLWMSEFVKVHGDVPKIFICDMSFAIIIAAIRSFGLHPNLTAYLDTIFNLLNRKNNPTNNSIKDSLKVPPCLIRIDFAHLMNNIRRNKALNSTGSSNLKVKDFYMRCVAILIQTRSLEYARAHIYSVLIVAKSKTEGI